MDSIHRFSVEGLEGQTIDFSAFRGKKILVVNTASECGLTPQYQLLEEMSTSFAQKLIVVGFPCNDFGGQEPGSADEIAAFCERNFGVSFPLGAKVDILGPSPSPIYRWLTTKAENGFADSSVSWNFQKYLLDENGHLIAVFSPTTSPLDAGILELIG